MNRWSALLISVLVLLASMFGISRHAHAQGGIGVTYPAGWNLAGAPDGSVFNSIGNVYTFQAGNTAYESSAGDSPISGGKGYWAYFSAPTSVTLNGIGSSSARVQAPAGQYIMVGNPSGVQSATVSGADQVLVYDAVAGSYRDTTTLAIGQGAWAFSASGGTITMTATGSAQPIPTAASSPTPAPAQPIPTATSSPTPAPTQPTQGGLTLVFLGCIGANAPYVINCRFSLSGVSATIFADNQTNLSVLKPTLSPNPGDYTWGLLPSRNAGVADAAGLVSGGDFLLAVFLPTRGGTFQVTFTEPKTGKSGSTTFTAN